MNKNIVFAMVAAATMCTAAAQAQSNADSVLTAEIKVVNLHCNNDMPTIKKRLLNQDGVDEVKFTDRNGDASVFTIVYHTAATSRPQIEKAIETTPGCDDKTETPYRVSRKKPKL
jgi:copper chaperone CopZ